MSNKQKSSPAYKRWEAMWDQAQARIERQKRAMTRLLSANTESAAALMEIADGMKDVDAAARRARRALDAMTEILGPDEAAADEAHEGD